MEHFDLDVGTMNIEELDKQIQLKKQQKIQMKQELLRRKHENDIDLEKKIRKEINNHTLEILLKRAENNENPEVKQLYYKLRALKSFDQNKIE